MSVHYHFQALKARGEILKTYTQSLHQSSIPQTRLGVTERVLLGRKPSCVTRLVTTSPLVLSPLSLQYAGPYVFSGDLNSLNTNNLESISRLAVHKVPSLDIDGSHCGCSRCQGTDGCHHAAICLLSSVTASLNGGNEGFWRKVDILKAWLQSTNAKW